MSFKETDDRESDADQSGMPWQLKGALAVGFLVAALGMYGYISESVEASSGDNPAILSSVSCFPSQYALRPADMALEGVYFYPGELDSMPVHQEGRANYYGDGEALNLHTSSGVEFDPEALAAASWFYPLGTTVRVMDLASGASVVVEVNDRGPNRVAYPEVVIDLTRGAMRVLHPIAGSLLVSVEPFCS